MHKKTKNREIIESYSGLLPIETKLIILKALKGYSEMTEKVEKYIKDNSNFNYKLIGKLLINNSIFQKNISSEKVENFFATKTNYYIIYNPEDFESFINHQNNNNISTSSSNENNNNHSSIIEKIFIYLNINKTEELEAQLNKFLSLNTNQELYKIEYCKVLNEIIIQSNSKDKPLREILDINTNKFNNAKKRFKLYKEIDPKDTFLITKLNSLSDNKVKTINNIEDLKEVK